MDTIKYWTAFLVFCLKEAILVFCLKEAIGIKSPSKIFDYRIGERKTFTCDWPSEFIKEFKNKTDIIIGFFFVMGGPMAIKSIEEAIKFCKA